jgi:cytochrome P450
MEKEGSALADRPHSIAADLLCNGLGLLQLHSGERLRRFRKAAHTHLQPQAAKTYQYMQLEIAKNVITDILDDPKNHRAHVQRWVHIRLMFW